MLTLDEIEQILKESPLSILLSPEELKVETTRIASIFDGTVNSIDEEVNHA